MALDKSFLHTKLAELRAEHVKEAKASATLADLAQQALALDAEIEKLASKDEPKKDEKKEKKEKREKTEEVVQRLMKRSDLSIEHLKVADAASSVVLHKMMELL